MVGKTKFSFQSSVFPAKMAPVIIILNKRDLLSYLGLIINPGCTKCKKQVFFPKLQFNWEIGKSALILGKSPSVFNFVPYFKPQTAP